MQKVFVSGATGVLGRRVVAELVVAGFDVTGVARRPASHADLAALGVRPVDWTCSTGPRWTLPSVTRRC